MEYKEILIPSFKNNNYYSYFLRFYTHLVTLYYAAFNKAQTIINKHKKLNYPLCLLVGILASVGICKSDETQFAANNFQTAKLNAIVTSATGFDLPIRNEPKNIFLIDKEDIQNKSYQNIEQALQYQPLVTFTDVGFGKNIDLRGQGADATRAVKILVNRVPISLLDTSHGVPPYNNIDIEDLQSIEILPGGGAVVYGNGTRGGVINFVTKAPSRDFLRFVSKTQSGEKIGLQGGNLSIAAGKKINDSLFIRADVNAGYSPGVRNVAGIASDRSQIKAFSQDNTTNIYMAFQTIWNLNQDSKLDFNINYSHIWNNKPINYLSMTRSVGTRPNTSIVEKTIQELKKERNSPDDYFLSTQTDAMQTSINYIQKFSDQLELDVLSFYQFSALKYTSYKYCLSGKVTERFMCPAGIMNMGDGSGFANHGGGINIKLKQTKDKNTLIVGIDNVLEYSNRLNHTDHFFPARQGNITAGTMTLQITHYITDVKNTATKLSNSIYIFDTFNFTSHFDLSGGARLEYSNYWTNNDQYYWQRIRSQTNNMTTFAENEENFKFSYHTQRLSYAAEITPNYKYSDTGNVYAKTELGFISPSAYQMINADPNSSINANQGTTLNRNEPNNISPEQYITAEIGFKDYIDPSYLSATLFYTHTFNEIFVNQISHGTAYTYNNLGQTQRLGIELIANQKLFETESLRLSQSLSYIYTNILKANISNNSLKGKNVPYVPFLKATLNIEVDIFKKNSQTLSIFLNNAYFSQSIDTKARVMNKNGYILCDLGLIYSIKNYKVNLGVRNLLDSYYVTYQNFPNYYPGLGRSYYLEIRLAFNKN
ncbi:TonB-dependent receptor [Helicobacter muridarum]|uniref:TonB-dependent heme receptor n=1 Tax=Helicobacter muridarum TaxID=216 RepID=A0A377PTI9_9HELI|nr:TonB-dependent receptor [Helicobacter muridarum]TLD97973.1 TonB-dependent receptor [Helicobacter muridarum]STQ86156.1 TonB-dependent heme receptor [Helicobacter muridarum]